MSGGTVNIARSAWDDTAFNDEPFSEREAWFWLIAEACWKDRQKRLSGHDVTVKRGQVFHSVRFMAERWKWSKSKVQRFLSRLEKRDMVVRESGTAAGLLTLCNYDEYQSPAEKSGTAAGQQAGRERDSSGTNDKKGNKGNKSSNEDSREAVAIWNDHASRHSWPKVQRLNPERTRSLIKRLQEVGGLDGWRIAMSKAAASSFIEQSTFFSFDWVIKPKNFTKLMEGNYDNRPSSGPGGGNRPADGHSTLFAGFGTFAANGPGDDASGGGSSGSTASAGVDRGPDCDPAEPFLRLASG